MSQPRTRRLPFSFSELSPDVRREVVYLDASDTAPSFAILYRPPAREPQTAVYVMHPRAEFSRHYVVPGLTAHGYAVFCHNSRYLNNDTDMVHERLLLDIAAGMRYLKDRGFERIVLLGNSGGGSLFAFYQAQAAKAAGERLSATPWGEPIDLAGELMPRSDLYIAVAAHLGEGEFLLNTLDPAVIDEDQPELSDPAWDMYNPANGYRPYPEPSHYELTWRLEYHDRQRERCARLDALAHQYLAEQATFRSALRSDAMADAAWDLRAAITRRARVGRYMVIHRTLANPAYLDPTIHPSRRPLGSIFSPGDPIIGNYGPGGLARVMTPRGWLSTWSGLASQANLLDTIGEISVPFLVVYADGDCDIFPNEANDIMEYSDAAADKQLVTLEWADHYLNPVGEQGAQLGDPRERLIDIIVPWIEERIGEP